MIMHYDITTGEWCGTETQAADQADPRATPATALRLLTVAEAVATEAGHLTLPAQPLPAAAWLPPVDAD